MRVTHPNTLRWLVDRSGLAPCCLPPKRFPGATRWLCWQWPTKTTREIWGKFCTSWTGHKSQQESDNGCECGNCVVCWEMNKQRAEADQRISLKSNDCESVTNSNTKMATTFPNKATWLVADLSEISAAVICSMNNFSLQSTFPPNNPNNQRLLTFFFFGACCYTAHNISMRRNRIGSIREFVEYVSSLPNFKTTIDRSSNSGISISYKTAEK